MRVLSNWVAVGSGVAVADRFVATEGICIEVDVGVGVGDHTIVG